MITKFIHDKMDFSNYCQYGIILQSEKRPRKIQIYIRSNRFNSLGRSCPFQTVLQIYWPQTLSANLCSLACLPSQKLSSCRPFSCSHIRYCSRYWKNSKYSVTHFQWAYPSHSRTSRISTSGHLENFPLEIHPPKSSKSTANPRQIPNQTIQASRITLLCYHRCGYDSVDCLRTSRVCPNGLQSQIPWETFLCSTYLQRRQNRFFSIIGVKTWQCPSFKRGMDILRTHHRKTAQHNGFFQNPYPSGCILLQWKDSTTFRREKYRICHCCQNVKTPEVANRFFPIPRICQRLGSNRIYFPSSKFQKGTSLYCHQTPQIVRTRRSPKKSFHFQKLCLSQSISYQFRSYSRRCLAILLQQRFSRTFAPGVEEFFFHGSNSNSQLPCKCNLHGNNSLGIRFGFSFSISMSARKDTTLEHFNTSPRTLVVTSRVGQTWRSQYFEAPKTIPTARFIFQNSKNNFKGQTFDLNQVANALIHQSDERC